MKLKRIAITFLNFMCLACCAASGLCREIVVENGRSTIQAAIDEAQHGDTVVIRDGLYFGEGNRNIDFKGKQILVKSQNGPYRTHVDCEDAGRGFLFQNSETETSILQGVTILNGADLRGGAIYCYDASPTIADCVLRDNSASQQGGALYCLSFARPHLINCLITGNNAPLGGALYCDFYSDVRFDNTTIAQNYATSGGGVYCNYYSSPQFANCIVWANIPNAFHIATGEPVVVYSAVTGGYPGEGNINQNPLFVKGYFGNFYLAQIQSGHPLNSPCMDAGSEPSETLCYQWADVTVCMNALTTSSYQQTDAEIADMGYHYPPIAFQTPTPTPSPEPTETPTITPTPTPTSTPTPTYAISLSMADSELNPGDTFRVQVNFEFYNSAPRSDLALMVVLQVHDLFFFYPDWTDLLNFQYVTVPFGKSGITLFDTPWPEIDTSMSGLIFWAALLEKELTSVYPDTETGIAHVTFSFAP